jgi:signal transduction histidine kinase
LLSAFKYYKKFFNTRKYIWTCFLFPILNLISLNSKAQSSVPRIDITNLSKYEVIVYPSVVFVPKKMDLIKEYATISEAFKLYKQFTIPSKDVPLKIITRLKLVNNGEEEADCYFFPGFFFSNVNLYKIEKGNQISVMPTVAPNLRDSASFRLIHLPAHDSITVLAECFQLKTYINVLRPRIIQKEYVSAFILELQNSKKWVTIFTYTFCGLLIMMVFFSLANFWLGRSREFLYYAAYALFLGIMLFTKQYYLFRSNHSNFFFEEYLDFLLQGTGICFYMAFMIRFLDTKKNYPFLHKLYTGGIVFLIAALGLYTFLHYGTDNYFLEELLENYITKIVLLVMIIIFLVYAARKWNLKIFRYLFLGNLFFIFFSLASLLMVLNIGIPRLPGILNNSVVLYEVGLLIELIFFLIALTYKNRLTLIEKVMESERLKLENEKKELEKQLAVMAAHQEERERISADMHDELGSGMTTIRLMSEIAKNKMKENVPVEIEKISSNANDLLNKMNAIIWSMNSSNDTLDSLISYIRAYAINYFDGTSITCKINIPSFIPSTEISGDKRRNIFLCLKEILNNSLKHSKATEIKIDITADKILKLKIADNGIGFEPENTRQFGNGLKNITRRMKNIGGSCTVDNNGGTETILELPL